MDNKDTYWPFILYPLPRLALSLLACQVGMSAARMLERRDGTGQHVMLPFVLQMRSSSVAERIR